MNVALQLQLIWICENFVLDCDVMQVLYVVIRLHSLFSYDLHFRTHTPQYAGSQKSQYDLSESFLDLLNFSAKFLKLHGRLVFWLPVVREE